MLVLTKPHQCSIHPDQIDVTQPFITAFNDALTAVIARYVVRLCQRNGFWQPFFEGQLMALFAQYHENGFSWGQLLEKGWIAQRKDSRCCVTIEFVEECFKAAPKQERVCA